MLLWLACGFADRLCSTVLSVVSNYSVKLFVLAFRDACWYADSLFNFILTVDSVCVDRQERIPVVKLCGMRLRVANNCADRLFSTVYVFRLFGTRLRVANNCAEGLSNTVYVSSLFGTSLRVANTCVNGLFSTVFVARRSEHFESHSIEHVPRMCMFLHPMQHGVR